VAFLYTAEIAVRHHELDQFGRLHPAVYLRYLAHAAVEASTAAGFNSAWYAAAGGLWIVRRTTFQVVRPVRVSEQLAIRTWVEDFRRVRSQRRYEVRGVDGALRLEGSTDWVYVDAASGRPRRVPAEVQATFGAASETARERQPWSAPPAPTRPARSEHRVCVYELDGLGHVNNAVYLDVLAQAVLDTLEAAGWPVDRLLAAGGVPVLGSADVEYLEPAVYGDRLEIATWFTPAPGALDAHQGIRRRGEERLLVQATTRWRWAESARGAGRDLPDGLLAALRPLLAA
jgi:acyl-CoA thioester hydrolase